MHSRTLLLLAFAALAATAEPPRPRLIDFNPWAWIPTSRNRSPSIMDYFFPPSRTPKNTNLATSPSNPPTSPSDLTTTVEERTTTRKASPTTVVAKSRAPTVTATYATSTPKPKKSSHKTTAAPPETTYEPRTTTVKPYSRDVTTTYKPTKYYTIKPGRTTTVLTTSDDSETTVESDSTETAADTESTLTTAADTAKDDTEATDSTAADGRSTDAATGTTPAVESTTDEAADSREGYLPLRDKPQPQQTHVKINEETKKETVPLPVGSTNVLAKPTKYHYYPHNQHIYLLPECAIQQVCNAVYVRLNYTQPLCACPNRYRDPCSASLNADDLHTTRLTTDSKKKYASKAVTLVKTCEAVSEMRECRAPRDWSLLALQNIRTGKSHYLVICRCPENHILEGPMSHDQPTYASVPGIRVYGMMCVKPTSFHSGFNSNRFTVSVQSSTSGYKVDYSQPHSYGGDKPVYNRFPTQGYQTPNYFNRMTRQTRLRRDLSGYPPFPWYKVREFAEELQWI